ncbi:MAG: hypothetical protein LBP86_11265 [Azoarcus sp.]|jgi:hypothetical protein|nr:hypothetical protein [Azoarcus sp.]
MEYIVRAVDVGFGNTKYVSHLVGGEIRCANFPSLAYPSMREPSAQPGFERRKTVSIPIDGLFYEVGPEVELAAGAFRATQMHDRYIETPEYLALLRGALAMMKLPVIDLLVVGLPVSFDWLVARGMRLVQNKSFSANRGVSDMLLAIADEIGADIGAPYGDIKAIDQALRTGKKPVIFQKPYDLSRAMPIVHSIAQQAVASMMRWVGNDAHGFQNIILVGGGA